MAQRFSSLILSAGTTPFPLIKLGNGLPLLVSDYFIDSLYVQCLNLIICLAHDSEMHFVKFTKEGVNSQEKPKSKRVVYRGNPILTGDFINENVYIGCGYD